MSDTDKPTSNPPNIPALEQIETTKSGIQHPQGGIYYETITSPREDKFLNSTGLQPDPLSKSINAHTQIKREATKQVLLEKPTNPDIKGFIKQVNGMTNKRALYMCTNNDKKKPIKQLRPGTHAPQNGHQKPVTRPHTTHHSLKKLVEKREQIIARNLGLVSKKKLMDLKRPVIKAEKRKKKLKCQENTIPVDFQPEKVHHPAYPGQFGYSPGQKDPVANKFSNPHPRFHLNTGDNSPENSGNFNQKLLDKTDDNLYDPFKNTETRQAVDAYQLFKKQKLSGKGLYKSSQNFIVKRGHSGYNKYDMYSAMNNSCSKELKQTRIDIKTSKNTAAFKSPKPFLLLDTIVNPKPLSADKRPKSKAGLRSNANNVFSTTPQNKASTNNKKILQ